MRKEIVFAVIAGSLFGLVIAFGVWRANLAIKTRESSSATTDEKQVTENDVQTKLGLTIAKPDEGDVITENPLTVTGISKPEAWIVISSDEEDFIFQTNESGSFEQEVNLTAGLNQLIVSAYDQDGTKEETLLRVVYSTEFLKEKTEEE